MTWSWLLCRKFVGQNKRGFISGVSTLFRWSVNLLLRQRDTTLTPTALDSGLKPGSMMPR